ncbi:paraquat-inducible protein A [Oceanomicrobium pacificus]|uniref:Paraquat-inducible membrane protein A n=1 Tax=Oceanomicrobium pacificus TaxID=2692916 RepID=A0A6B0TX79_9RHOB|nr:paraquat-inducible protein A [Oceanomicrobium pacificus]MXU66088.1 paraquat-inducible membrane protein A [Oceanomicrobium pacificus]
MADARSPAGMTARRAGLIGCTSCGRVYTPGATDCPLCGQALHSREPASMQKVWAWLIAGFCLYVPANLMPMLVTSTLGQAMTNTIIGGAVELALHGSWFIAFVVLFASVAIPVGKFLVIGILALSVQYDWDLNRKTRLHMYEVVEFIGRWSMVDVFVVAILTALVQFGFIVNIHPGPAAVCFALSVALTMVSAQCFDPRLLWDSIEEDRIHD